MKTRLNGPFVAICISLPALAAIADGDAKLTRKTIRAKDGLSIVCDTGGKGDTTLVFLHGWCGDRTWWKSQVNAFAGDYRVVIVDQAGHGESGKERKEWTVEALAQDVATVVKELKLKRVILIGHSMGGPIALAAAKRMPGKVVAVVGVDTLHNAEFKPPEEQVKQFIDGFETDFKGTMRMGLQGMLPEKVDPALFDSIYARATNNDQKMAVALMRNLSRSDVKTLLSEAKAPVRCINSAPVTPFARPTDIEINKKYADFNAIIIEGCGHFPMLEKPAEFNEKLRCVLKEFAGRR